MTKKVIKVSAGKSQILSEISMEKSELLLKFAWENWTFFYPYLRPPRFETRLTPLATGNNLAEDLIDGMNQSATKYSFLRRRKTKLAICHDCLGVRQCRRNWQQRARHMACRLWRRINLNGGLHFSN